MSHNLSFESGWSDLVWNVINISATFLKTFSVRLIKLSVRLRIILKLSLRLKLKLNDKKTKYHKHTKHLGMILARSLTYRKQLENTWKKLKFRTSIVQKLVGTTWGGSGKTMRITTQFLVMSVADYCSPVWSSHVKLVDIQINIALCGTVQSTEVDLPFGSSSDMPTTWAI